MPATPAPARRRYPLYVYLSVLFSALVLAAGALIAWLGYVASRDVALAAARETFGHIGRETQSSVRDALQPVAHLAELLALQPLARAGTLDERLDALPVMRLGIGGDAAIDAAYVGYDDGSFFQLRPLPDDAARTYFGAPAGSAFMVQSVEPAAGGARTTYLFYDAALRELARRVPTARDYDPRTRPWYRLATEPGKRVLTEPYVFFTTGSTGVTVALRTASGSVVGIDATLDQVSQRLASLRSMPGMKIALFDSGRRVLARADRARATPRASDGVVALATLDEQGEPALAALVPAVAGAPASTRTVTAGGEDWETVVLPIETVRGQLSLGIAVPQAALLEEARATRLRGLVATIVVLLIAVPLTGWVAHRVSSALTGITREAEDIRAFRFDGAPSGGSIVLEIDQLSGAVNMMRNTIRNFLDITASLAAETNSARLLDRVVSETSATMGAAGGVLYLPDEQGMLVPGSVVDAEGRALDATPQALPGDALSPVAAAVREGRTVVATLDAGAAPGAQEFARRLWPGDAVVLTAIPLRDRARETVGVLALFQPGTLRPSTAQLAFVEALSGTMAVAIETQRLLEARKALLDAFIRLIAGAIDAKSPYTGGHCARVPELTFMLARAACAATDGPYRDFALSDEEWEAVQIASWLHDCGKVTTPEYVVDKATKLEAIYDRIHEVRTRFEVLKRDAEIAFWKDVCGGGDRDAAAAALARMHAVLDDEFAFVAGCNVGGESMDPAKVERLRQIARRTWLRTLDDRLGLSHEERERKARAPAPPLPAVEHLLADRPEHVIARAPGEAVPADNPWGFRLQAPEHRYDRGELHNLAVASGTLTAEERYVINHHITQTIVMLSQLPFPKHLKSVPEIAGGHHERMDGNGYPKGLRAGEMSPVARMMAIADVFEALTASDRPYKAPKKLSEALAIMGRMKRNRHIDPDLFDLFLTAGVYRRYAERFLSPEQIDDVDVAPLLGPVEAPAAA